MPRLAVLWRRRLNALLLLGVSLLHPLRLLLMLLLNLLPARFVCIPLRRPLVLLCLLLLKFLMLLLLLVVELLLLLLHFLVAAGIPAIRRSRARVRRQLVRVNRRRRTRCMVAGARRAVFRTRSIVLWAGSTVSGAGYVAFVTPTGPVGIRPTG